MNSQNNKNINKLGIVLTDNANLEWLREIDPHYHYPDIKFDVNIKMNKVSIGMITHKCTCVEMGDNTDLLGGFIELETGKIRYESNLNIPLNKKLGSHGDTLREIVDKEWIEKINTTLFSWITL
ncbi:MAG: hypothetical protein LBC35_03855 [Coriobacteriales bacterium]|jgi:hypothetical protein|nr:hypothetical protein [Coriobacteriales bacterium]